MPNSNLAVPTPTTSVSLLNPYNLHTNPQNPNCNTPDETIDTESLTNATTQLVNAISTFIGKSINKRWLFIKELRDNKSKEDSLPAMPYLSTTL